MLPQIVGYVVGGVLMFAYDVVKSSRKDKPPPEPPLLFTPAQVELFTHLVSAEGFKAREFDADAMKTMRLDLAERSAIPQELPPPIQAIATAWRVVPLNADAPRASEVVAAAHEAGATVLGSLSLVLLMSGIDAPYVLLVGKSDVRSFAPMRDERGMPPTFAILPPPPVELSTTAPVPAEETTQEAPPAPAVAFPSAPAAPASPAPSSAPTNGASKPAVGLAGLVQSTDTKIEEA